MRIYPTRKTDSEAELALKKRNELGSVLINSKKTKSKNPFIIAPYLEGTTPQGFLHDWVNSSEYKKRLNTNEYQNTNEVVSKRNRNLKGTVFNPVTNGGSIARVAGKYGGKSIIDIDTQQAKEYGKETVQAHELSHTIGASNPGFYDTSMNEVEYNMFKKANINRSSNAHDAMGAEMKADLDANRFNLFKNKIYDVKKGIPFNQNDLLKTKKALKGDITFDRLIKQTGNENYIKLMNSIASDKLKLIPVAERGMSLKSKLISKTTGSILKPNETRIYKNGGALFQISQGKEPIPLQGEERVYSITDTKQMIKLSLDAKTDKDLIELGKFFCKATKKQDKRKPEYTNT
jgi:hypothetical protein